MEWGCDNNALPISELPIERLSLDLTIEIDIFLNKYLMGVESFRLSGA